MSHLFRVMHWPDDGDRELLGEAGSDSEADHIAAKAIADRGLNPDNIYVVWPEVEPVDLEYDPREDAWMEKLRGLDK